MLVGTALNFANHLLSGEAWARARLKVFAGQTVRLEFGALHFPVTITRAGLLETAASDAPVAVNIRLPDDAPLRALTDHASLLASIRIAGTADFAETLGFVLRNLRWDAEEDLSLLVGDIAARRLILGGKSLLDWHLRRARNFALNVAEYFTEEDPVIVRRADLARFCAAVATVRDDCAWIEKRLQRLEGG